MRKEREDNLVRNTGELGTLQRHSGDAGTKRKVFKHLDTRRGPWYTTSGRACVTLVGSQEENMGSYVH